MVIFVTEQQAREKAIEVLDHCRETIIGRIAIAFLETVLETKEDLLKQFDEAKKKEQNRLN